jgi:hypothetical protein
MTNGSFGVCLTKVYVRMPKKFGGRVWLGFIRLRVGLRALVKVVMNVWIP